MADEEDKLGHDYRAVIEAPGAGPSRVCRKCGIREPEAKARKAVCRVVPLRPRGVVSEYDPIGPDAA